MVHSSIEKGCMEQMHKRFTAEQVQVLLKGYCQGTLDRSSIKIKETLGILKNYAKWHKEGYGERVGFESSSVFSIIPSI
jgi:hypothetical protein